MRHGNQVAEFLLGVEYGNKREMKASPYTSVHEEETLSGLKSIVLKGKNPTEMDVAVRTMSGKISNWLGVSKLRYSLAK